MIISRRRNVIVLFSLALLIMLYSIFFSYDHLDSFNNKLYSSSVGDVFSITTFNESEELSDLKIKYKKLNHEIERLQEHIFFLEQQLLLCSYPQKNKYTQDTQSSEKRESRPYKNEADLEGYSAFTNFNYFPVDRPLYNRQIIKITGGRKNNIKSLVSLALRHLNKYTPNKYQLSDFQMGFERASPTNGFQYELLFKNLNDTEYIRLSQPLQTLRFLNRAKPKRKEIINFVLPLSMEQKSINAFKYFLSLFEMVALRNDDRQATLTVVFSYKNPLELASFQSLDRIMNEFKDRTGFVKIKLIKVNAGQFSRANLLQIGSENCCKNTSNSLMFFCDIDIIFNQNFLDLCRFNTRRTEQVYFPILYSFYNPSLSNATSLEELYKRIESPKVTSFTASDVGKLNLTINDEIGTWRPSGFGMACLYQEDFESIGGFGDYIAKNVWGGEDLHLFRKFLKSKLSVFRAITPGLFHMYHQKHCDKLKMTEVQFNECMMVKISSEASLKSLGLLHFNNNQF